MTDVFLSYSRKDSDSVKDLFASLSARNREIWIDLHGIEYSSKWWDEICAGIDGADNFVLMVSQNSLESLFCHLEINHALKQHKRIIPFQLTTIDQKAMFKAWQNDPELCKYEQLTRENWESIQSIQWIDFTQIKDIERGVEALLVTVDTDPERVKLHTRLLLRMHDWESTGRNPSGLLRGDELVLYEKWFNDSRQKETPPHPTDKQEAYIIESRRVQNELEAKRIQRERLVKGFRVASIGLGVFLILTVLAIFFLNSRVTRTTAQVAFGNTQIAISEKTLTPIPPTLTAVAQTVVAGSYMIESLNLSGEANSILRTQGGNAETAALLSIRALRKIYLPSADAALMDAANRLKAIPITMPVNGYLSRVSFSPDGKTFVIASSGSATGTILQLWDSMSTLIIWTNNEDYMNINSVAFSPNGKLIVIATSKQTAVIIDATTGKEIKVLSGYRDAVRQAIFTPDNKKILTSGIGSDITLRLWDVETGKEIYSKPGTWGGSVLLFSSNGLIFNSNGLSYNTFDGSPNKDQNIGGAALALSPDGNTYVSGFSSIAKLRNTKTGQDIRSFVGHTDIVKSAAFSGDGKLLVTTGVDNTSRIWEVATGKQLMILSGMTNQDPSVAFSPDGTQVLTGGNSIRLWNLAPIEQQFTFSISSGITASALSPDGKTILIGEEDGNTGLWDLNSGKLLQKFSKDRTYSKTVAFSPDGKLVAISVGSQTGFDSVDINLYEVSTGTLKKTFSITTPHPMVYSLAFSSDSSMLLATLEDNVSRLFRVESGQLLRSIKGENPNAVISPDGNLISLNSGSKWFDIALSKEIDFSNEEMNGNRMNGNRMFFSPDGSLLGFGNPDGSIFVWDFKNKILVHEFSGHSGEILNLAFSPDNKLLLSGGADRTARLWDISAGQQIRVFSGHTAAVMSVGFISNGKKIVTTSMDKTVRTWFIDYNDLMDYVCTFLGSDFSVDERVVFGVSDQDPTCPQFGAQSKTVVPTPTPFITLTPLPVWTPIATPTQGN